MRERYRVDVPGETFYDGFKRGAKGVSAGIVDPVTRARRESANRGTEDKLADFVAKHVDEYAELWNTASPAKAQSKFPGPSGQRLFEAARHSKLINIEAPQAVKPGASSSTPALPAPAPPDSSIPADKIYDPKQGMIVDKADVLYANSQGKKKGSKKSSPSSVLD